MTVKSRVISYVLCTFDDNVYGTLHQLDMLVSSRLGINFNQLYKGLAITSLASWGIKIIQW